MNSGAFQVPMPGKPNEDGEDVFLQLVSSKKHRGVAGVFDGVGGWYESGIDPRVYTEALAEEMAIELEGTGTAEGSEGVVAALGRCTEELENRQVCLRLDLHVMA